MIKITFLLILIFLNLRLERNLLFTSNSANSDLNELLITLFYGKKYDKELPKNQEFLYDIGINETFVGNGKTDNKWGINCDSDIAKCKKIKNSNITSYYFENKIDSMDYLYFLRLKNSDSFNDNIEYQMRLSLMEQNTNYWRLNNKGVWGLGVNSQFVKFMIKLYNLKNFKICFFFENNTLENRKNKSEKIEDLYFIKEYTSKVYFNSDKIGLLKNRQNTFNYTYDYSKIKFSKFEPSGAIHISNSSINSKKIDLKTTENVDICIINNSEDVIILMEYQIWSNSIEKIICKKDKNFFDINECDINKAPNIEVNLNKKIYNLKGKDYMFIKEEKKRKKWATRFGDISGYLGTYCKKGTELALGRGFFENKGFEITYNKNNSTIEIFDLIKHETTGGQIFLIILIILIFVCLFSLGIFIIIKFKKRNKNEESEQYYNRNE